jgi:hypothetical protein
MVGHRGECAGTNLSSAGRIEIGARATVIGAVEAGKRARTASIGKFIALPYTRAA